MVVSVISCVSNFKGQCLHCGMPISVTTVSLLPDSINTAGVGRGVRYDNTSEVLY